MSTRVLLVPDLPIEGWPSMDRYASRLARLLQRYATDLDVVLAGEIAGLTLDNRHAYDGVRISPDIPAPILPTGGLAELQRYVARYVMYPQRVRRHRADVLHVLDHSYAHVLLRRGTRPCVVTVHDLLPVLTVRRGGAGPRNHLRTWLLRRVLRGLRRADGWIVATEWLRGELAEWLGDERHVHVIPFGVDDAFFEEPAQDRAETRRRWRIPPGAFVVLHVGSVGPRKNLSAVIAAVDGLRRAGVDAWLLQVGGRLTAEQEADLGSRNIARYASRVGEVEESDLRAAYRTADVLLFPSHYEGFGFPVLEAMASGLPVVTSGAGGLAEVAGDAAIVVGGRESEPYVAALKKLVANDHWRRQLVERGRARARAFRWVETARKTAEVYRGLV